MNDHPTVLLLGAKAGALFRSEHFYVNLQQFSNRDFNKLSRGEKFGECYTILTKNQFSETDIHSILRASLRDLAVTRADVCLADLVKRGHFGEIISTNVDEVLEKALIAAEMSEQREFEVFIPGRLTLHYEKSLPCRITKVFGDLAAREYNISRRHSHLDSKQELKNFLQHILERDILVVGIDPIWDEDILRAIPQGPGTMWFVNEEDLSEHPLISGILDKRHAKCIAGRQASYDNFVSALYERLYGNFIPMNYQLASDILSRLQVLQDEQQVILGEIKKLRNEIGNLSQSISSGE